MQFLRNMKFRHNYYVQGFGGFFVTACKDEEKSRSPESWLPSRRMFCVTANLSKKYIGIFVLIQKTVFYLIQLVNVIRIPLTEYDYYQCLNMENFRLFKSEKNLQI